MIEKSISVILEKKFNKTIKDATNEEVYSALLQVTKSAAKKKDTTIKELKNYIIYQLNF